MKHQHVIGQFGVCSECGYNPSAHITVTLTEHQVDWIISSLEFDETHGSEDDSIRAFRKRLLTTLAKAKTQHNS